MSIETSIKQLIKDAVTDIYGYKNLETMFITGSIAAGFARSDSDIDIVVCYKDGLDALENRRSQFTEFYYGLHKQLGREPDHISPGEVLSYDVLNKALNAISCVEPANILHSQDEFDAICWAGMLVSKKDIIVPLSDGLKSLHKTARFVTYRWATLLCPLQEMTEGTGLSTDIDKRLRRAISCPGYYDAH